MESDDIEDFGFVRRVRDQEDRELSSIPVKDMPLREIEELSRKEQRW